jgi:hypothetical protein
MQKGQLYSLTRLAILRKEFYLGRNGCNQMKPGVKKLLNYLQKHNALNLANAKNVSSFWSEQTIKRFVDEFDV